MKSQIRLPKMLPEVVLTGLLLFGLPVQGIDLLPFSPPKFLSDLAEMAVQESLSVYNTGSSFVDKVWSSLGLNTPDSNSIKFVLFNQANRESGIEVAANPESLRSSLKPGVPTKIFVHGYRNNIDSEVPALMKNDWSELAAFPFYANARSHVDVAAQRTALLLDALADSNISAPKDQHIIGHSLGAHVAGLASKQAKTKAGRCTGLDPAGPLFQFSTDRGRIDAMDAGLVDVIHTTAAFWGIPKPVGKVDFYPNGGVWPQPGCGLDIDGDCSHAMSAKFFAYSISNPNVFNGSLCEAPGIIKGDCPKSTDGATMGEYIRFQKPGMYYLQAEVPQRFLTQN